MFDNRKVCAILIASFLLLVGAFFSESLLVQSSALNIGGSNTEVPVDGVGNPDENIGGDNTNQVVDSSNLNKIQSIDNNNTYVMPIYNADVTDNDPSEILVNVNQSGIAMQILDASAVNAITALNLQANPSPTGNFVKGTAIVEVGTSNPTGYVLTMTSNYKDHENAYTTDLVYPTSGVTDAIQTITPASGTSITETQFSARNSSYQNKWGFSLNAVTVTVTEAGGVTTKTVTPNSNPGNITYSAIPSHSSTVTVKNDVTTAVAQSYAPVTIGSNVNTSIRAGTYSNQLIFTATGNPQQTLFRLKFNDNGKGDTVSSMPTMMTYSTLTSQHTFTVPNNTPTRTGYSFVGWSTNAAAPMGSGSGTDGLYVSGDTITLTYDSGDASSNTETLYAWWQQVPSN